MNFFFRKKENGGVVQGKSRAGTDAPSWAPLIELAWPLQVIIVHELYSFDSI